MDLNFDGTQSRIFLSVPSMDTPVGDSNLLTRAVFVVDHNNRVTYIEYVPETADHLNYNDALQAAKSAM